MNEANRHIDLSLTLDDRLYAGGQEVAVPGKPGQSVFTQLVHVPSRISATAFPSDAPAVELVPILNVDFRYAEEAVEHRRELRWREPRATLSVVAGEHSGRVYALRLRRSDDSRREPFSLLMECLDRLSQVEESVRLKASLKSISSLIELRLEPALSSADRQIRTEFRVGHDVHGQGVFRLQRVGAEQEARIASGSFTIGSQPVASSRKFDDMLVANFDSSGILVSLEIHDVLPHIGPQLLSFLEGDQGPASELLLGVASTAVLSWYLVDKALSLTRTVDDAVRLMNRHVSPDLPAYQSWLAPSSGHFSLAEGS